MGSANETNEKRSMVRKIADLLDFLYSSVYVHTRFAIFNFVHILQAAGEPTIRERPSTHGMAAEVDFMYPQQEEACRYGKERRCS